MIADVAKTLAGEEGRHLAIEAPTGVGKTLSYLIPGIAIAREEQKTLVVSTPTWRCRIRFTAKIYRC
ncbi:ATP-dependent DNA helicase DinG [Escherichia coli]|uniref:ATP-dependent DNA helicase DinG n=1 Tax=Escherichia coli TaxID=562 RepID=A0A376VMJ5_ECOLX|nr:ATP-dependent DNA helicase DinG [Escherichia coli]